MNEDNIQGMIGQARLASGTPSVESTVSTPGMGFSAEPAASVFGQPKNANASPMETQYQQMLATAKKAANDVKRRYLAGQNNGSGQPQQQVNMPGFVQSAAADVNGGDMKSQMSSAWNATVPAPSVGVSSVPQQPLTPLPQFTQRKAMFGTDALPSYEYGGMTVSLPKGIDMNDSAAVRKAVEENNMYIDMLNDDEEGF